MMTTTDKKKEVEAVVATLAHLLQQLGLADAPTATEVGESRASGVEEGVDLGELLRAAVEGAVRGGSVDHLETPIT